MSSSKYKLLLLSNLFAVLVMLFGGLAAVLPQAYAATCGGVTTSIDYGCSSQTSSGDKNPIVLLLYAVVRFLTAGAGIVIVGSLVVGGIQYTTSQGDPQAQAKARGRVISALGALLLFIFTFALLQWLVPGGVF